MRRASLAEVCNWIAKAWKQVPAKVIVNGFKKAEIVAYAADDRKFFLGLNPTLTKPRLLQAPWLTRRFSVSINLGYGRWLFRLLRWFRRRVILTFDPVHANMTAKAPSTGTFFVLFKLSTRFSSRVPNLLTTCACWFFIVCLCVGVPLVCAWFWCGLSNASGLSMIFWSFLLKLKGCGF